MSAWLSKLENFERPSPIKICALVLFSYFVVTAGIAYDIINEPPAFGGEPDPRTGVVRPITFMPYRMNGQYIIEGLSGGFFFTLGGLGLILMDKAHDRRTGKSTRTALLGIGAGLMLVSYAACMGFIRIKMPNYLREEQ